MAEAQKITRDEPRSLMNELIKRVLPIGPRLAPVNGARFVTHTAPVQRDRFAVTLHRELLQVSRQSLEILVVRQDGDRFSAENVGIPNGEQRVQHGKVA